MGEKEREGESSRVEDGKENERLREGENGDMERGRG